MSINSVCPYFETSENKPLLEYLLGRFRHLKRTKVKQFLKHGSVVVNGVVVTRHNHPLRIGDKVEILTKESAVKEKLKSQLGFPIVYEDASVIVIEKPEGLLTMGTDRDKIHTAYFELACYLKDQNPEGHERLFIVHRLDRETSGLLVFAKNQAAKRALQENWRKFSKRYFAVVEGTPRKTAGVVESYLMEDKFKRVHSVPERRAGAKRAITTYKTLRQNGRYALLDAAAVTGRKHQIRVHLADLGHPVIGDRKYKSASNPIGRLGLHAYFLSFTHPKTGETKTFETPLPSSFANLLSRNK